MKGYKFWQGSGISFNEETKLFERIDFELELFFPVNDSYYLTDFMRSQKEFIWKGRKIMTDTILILSKEARRMTFTFK